MSEISDRLRRRVTRDFPAPGSAEAILVALAEEASSERVQAAIVMWAAGDLGRFREGLAMAKQDWRDALCRVGLQNDDWAERLMRELGD